MRPVGHLEPSAPSLSSVLRIPEGYPRRHWLQWTVAVNSGRRLVVAQVARHGLYNAGATPRPLLDAASPRLPVGVVLSNAACDRERHHQDIRHHIGADRVIPAKRGKADWHMR
jgi:hypothetical protein